MVGGSKEGVFNFTPSVKNSSFISIWHYCIKFINSLNIRPGAGCEMLGTTALATIPFLTLILFQDHRLEVSTEVLNFNRHFRLKLAEPDCSEKARRDWMTGYRTDIRKSSDFLLDKQFSVERTYNLEQRPSKITRKHNLTTTKQEWND